MIITPMGELAICVNNKRVDYLYTKLPNIELGTKNLPIFKVSERYKLVVEIDPHEKTTVECSFANDAASQNGSINSGEKLALKTWERQSLMLSLGVEDEIKGVNIEYLKCGLKVHIAKFVSINQVIFGVSWVYIEDCGKENYYTWYASDPTLY